MTAKTPIYGSDTRMPEIPTHLEFEDVDAALLLAGKLHGLAVAAHKLYEVDSLKESQVTLSVVVDLAAKLVDDLGEVCDRLMTNRRL